MDWENIKINGGAALLSLRRKLEQYSQRKDHNQEYLAHQTAVLRDLETYYYTAEAALQRLEQERAAAYAAGRQAEQERQAKAPSAAAIRQEGIRLYGKEGYRNYVNSQAMEVWRDHYDPWQPVPGKKYKMDKQGNIIEM